MPVQADSDGAHFALPDPRSRLRAVRLWHELAEPLPTDFSRRGRTWRLDVPRPDVDRMEYLLSVIRDGSDAFAPDPGNPRRASGPFGEKSVVEFPEYRPPAWIGRSPDGWLPPAPRVIGGIEVTLLDDGLGPLLVVHDGPEYAEFSQLLIYLQGLRPLRVALLQPRNRNDEYSASAVYARRLVERVLPELPQAPRIGVGASLGALALLHAERVYPHTFSGLFLQSGSFFRRRQETYERGFWRFARITRFVAALHRGSLPSEIPIVLTCGTGEENLECNRALARTLQAPLHEVRDAHNWTAWRDSLDPHLCELVALCRGVGEAGDRDGKAGPGLARVCRSQRP
jgi:hypothetical protein